MIVLYIIVEGQTEEEFVNNSLRDFFFNYNINATPILLETSPGHFGGDLSYVRYKSHLQNYLSTNDRFIISSLIDYYQLKTDYPGYNHSLTLGNSRAAVEHIESQISLDIPDKRFIPYIQLHEFEALLFSDINGFNYINTITQSKKIQIQAVIDAFPNPEDINNGPTTAPSKRLGSIIPKYKKTLHGPIIAMDNGVQAVLDKCPRFKSWVDGIIALSKTI